MELIINGGFEQPAGGGLNLTNLPGWYVSENVDSVNQGDGWPPYEGDQSLDLSGCTHAGSYIEQAFPTEPLHRYQLSFRYGNNIFTSFSTGTVRLVGAAILVEETLAHGGSTAAGMNYILFQTNFVADSSQTTLRFTHLFADCEGLALDAVSVVEVAPVPLLINGGFEEPFIFSGAYTIPDGQS